MTTGHGQQSIGFAEVAKLVASVYFARSARAPVHEQHTLQALQLQFLYPEQKLPIQPKYFHLTKPFKHPV